MAKRIKISSNNMEKNISTSIITKIGLPHSSTANQSKDNCPLCKEKHIQDFDKFFTIANAKPYTKNHIMLLPKEHIHSEIDFTQEIKDELIYLHIKILERFYELFGAVMYITRESTPLQSQWHWHRHYMPTDEWLKVNRVEYSEILFKI